MTPAPPATVRQRNEAIDELRPRIDLREDLAVLGEEARTGVDPVSLAAWGEAAPAIPTGGLRTTMWLLTGLGAIGFAALLTWVLAFSEIVHLTPPLQSAARDVAIVIVAINGLFLHRHKASTTAVVTAVEGAAHELGLLSEVLVRLEREKFKLACWPTCARLSTSDGEPPSQQIARLNKLVERLDSRDNVAVRVLEPFILWTMHTAAAVEDWRSQHGTAVRRWLTATGEMEALCALAGYAFEHPADPFAELVEGPVAIDAESHLPPPDPIWTGCLQQHAPGRLAASPDGQRVEHVREEHVPSHPWELTPSWRRPEPPVRAGAPPAHAYGDRGIHQLSDSLQGGVSRFYAEILRIRQILSLTSGPLPVLFLIDEFLAGTNSHDRRIGAGALVRGLWSAARSVWSPLTISP